MKSQKISESVLIIMNKIKKAGFESYLVGGCVRDLLLGGEPKDWDVTTNAKPEELLKIIPDGKYENSFGTVMVPLKYIKTEQEETVDGPNIEITTYRIESTYSDKRHPDEVQFAETLEEDLSRRDFTVNAMAIELDEKGNQKEIVDLFNGQKDLESKVIRAVGEPDERFNEDALRMMRAIRFSVQIGFEIEKKTFVSIEKNSKNLQHISQERIRDEFDKIIISQNPSKGVELLIKSKLMDQFIPEVIETIGVKQNRHHYYGPYNTVYAHMLASLKKCPSEKLEVRLASFFHDIGKPNSKRGEGEMATFYGHEYGGAKIVDRIMNRMKYPRKIIEKTVLLVKNHMFYYNVDEVGEAGVRKVIRKVGLENINDLIDVRIADRLGSGVPKAVPYRLRHFKYMVEKVSKDPISVKQLKLNGDIMITEMNFKPSREIGAILDVLLAEVIEKPELNEKEGLMKRVEELRKEDLQSLRFLAKKKIKEEQKKEEEETKGKYYVK